jgi:8-amino-7-oxononanoate synthase
MFSEKLRIFKENSLLREIKDRESPQGSRINLNGMEYINFSSNDYLGLANHPHIIDKMKSALDNYGYGSAASRLLGGGTKLHKEIEERVAKFKNVESSLVFNSGYAANTGIIPAIADESDVIYSDEFNHASIIDGCRLSRARTLIYRHKDLSHLEALISRGDSARKIVVTDAVFSMDGDISPLGGIFDICKENNAILYIDDAHGTGVLGNGRGALSHFSIEPQPWIIQMGTFSKALGSFGAFAAGSREVVELILNAARSFIFSTALPACVVAGSIAALELMEEGSELIRRLWANRNNAADNIKHMGYDIMESETPIIPLRTGTVENTLKISRHLYEEGIFAPAIRPPTVAEPRIRITVTAAHTENDLDRLFIALRNAKI